jgi:hypothetical protein
LYPQEEVRTLDYIEIMNLCGYDLEAANTMACQIAQSYCTEDVVEEVLTEIGLESIQPNLDASK